MSYFIDTKYLHQISHRLPLFAAKKKDLWNCRCILCGDSSTNKKKARGYFYRNKNDLFYKCHNCGASQHFGTFLQMLDTSLYQQYVFERYASGENGPKAHKSAEVFVKFEQPQFEKKSELDKVATRLDKLPQTNEAVQYCLQRKIPLDVFDKLYYIESVQNIKQIAPQYDTIKTTEPRLLFPFYNEKGTLTGVTMRALRGESLRYIMIKIQDNEPLLFGLNHIDKTSPIYIVEGPIDSLFLPNAIACNGTAFAKIETLQLPKDKVTIVFDNQPRNVEVCKLVEKYVDLNYSVCIWPCNISAKDINDMVQENVDVLKIINDHTYKGLMAKVKFTEWRNC